MCCICGSRDHIIAATDEAARRREARAGKMPRHFMVSHAGSLWTVGRGQSVPCCQHATELWLRYN